MFSVNPPGPWQKYVTRADNVGLDIMTVRNKYLNEQLQFENFMSFQMQQQHMQQQQSSPAGPPKSTVIPLPSECIEFVANTTEGSYFEFTVSSNIDDFSYTVNWGNGTIEEGTSSGGSVTLSHVYGDGVADYTVRVCFDDPSLITSINFPGFD